MASENELISLQEAHLKYFFKLTPIQKLFIAVLVADGQCL